MMLVESLYVDELCKSDSPVNVGKTIIDNLFEKEAKIRPTIPDQKYGRDDKRGIDFFD